MFARRPKASDRKDLIEGKINSELVGFANASRRIGIPSIAGYPASRSLPDLYSNPSLIWFDLSQFRQRDTIFAVDFSQEPLTPRLAGGRALQTLTLTQISEDICKNARTFTWDEAMEHCAALRLEESQNDYRFGFGWLGGYKPVYFLMFD
jgi:hypothetical protein